MRLAAQEFPAVHPWHDQIKQNKAWARDVRQALERLLSIASGHNLAPLFSQEFNETVASGAIIVDNQKCLHNRVATGFVNNHPKVTLIYQLKFPPLG